MFKKNLLRIHKWLGLFAGSIVLVISLSGSMIVFDDEIENFIHRDIIHSPNSQRPVSLDNAYDSARYAYPEWGFRITLIPTEANRAIEIELRRNEDRRYLYVHPATGEILRDLDRYNTVSYWLLRFHYQLHSGLLGEIILLTTAFMLLGSLITGFWFYRKAVWRVLTFKIRPRFRDFKTGTSELHRTVGVWALVFNLITTVTGAFILWNIVAFHVQEVGQPPERLPNPPPVEISLDQTMEKARRTYPGFNPIYVIGPTEPGRSLTLYGNTDTDWFLHNKFSNFVRFNPETGETSATSFIKDKSWSAHLYRFMYPLHYGDWGGIFIKIFYSFFGMAPAMLSITGFIIWRHRAQRLKSRRRKTKRHQAKA